MVLQVLEELIQFFHLSLQQVAVVHRLVINLMAKDQVVQVQEVLNTDTAVVQEILHQ